MGVRRDRATLVARRKHIAYISNEGGNTALWVIDLPGAQRRQIVAAERRYLEPVGRLRIVVVDAAGRPLAARLAVASADGRLMRRTTPGATPTRRSIGPIARSNTAISTVPVRPS